MSSAEQMAILAHWSWYPGCTTTFCCQGALSRVSFELIVIWIMLQTLTASCSNSMTDIVLGLEHSWVCHVNWLPWTSDVYKAMVAQPQHAAMCFCSFLICPSTCFASPYALVHQISSCIFGWQVCSSLLLQHSPKHLSRCQWKHMVVDTLFPSALLLGPGSGHLVWFLRSCHSLGYLITDVRATHFASGFPASLKWPISHLFPKTTAWRGSELFWYCSSWKIVQYLPLRGGPSTFWTYQ